MDHYRSGDADVFPPTADLLGFSRTTIVPFKKKILAEQTFSLLDGNFSHLSKNILYTRPVERTHKKVGTFFTLTCYFYLI